VVLILWTLLGQRSLLEAFDLVDVLREAVLAMFFVHFPLHLNLAEPAMCVSPSAPVLVADATHERRHQGEESSAPQAPSSSRACAVPSAVAARGAAPEKKSAG